MTLRGHSLRWFGVGVASAMLAVACMEIAFASPGPRAGGAGLFSHSAVLLACVAAASVNALSAGFGVAALWREKTFCPWALISLALAAGIVWAAFRLGGNA